MRLTIRTLLGYMDDILDPQDAEEIGRRIEESEVATTLYHRIRDVTRRLSLKAPDLDDEGDGLDPNTVAEYLDNVLPDDRVPDLEKICLDSDMHLAEVAACHQILAVALGEPAEISPESREHMYQLPQVAADLANLDRPPHDPFGVPPDGNVDSIAGIPQRPSPIVPDYLRENSRRIPVVPIVMGAIAVACVLIIILALSGVFSGIVVNPNEKVAQNDGKTPVGQNGKTDDASNTPRTNQGEDVGSGDPQKSTSDPNEVTPNPSEVSNEGSPTLNPPLEGTLVPDTSDAPPLGNDAVPDIPGVTDNATTASPDENLGPNPVPENPTNPSGPSSEKDPPEEGAEVEPVKPKVVEPEKPALIGRFVSDGQALVQLDPADKSWKVIPQQGPLIYPTPIVALPTFRPIIATASGLSVQLMSETQITMQPTQSDAMPVLKLQNGKVVLRSLGKPNMRLLLTAGNKTGILTLVNLDSAAAIEVTFSRKPGDDPLKVPSTVITQLTVISGTVLWEEDSKGEPLKIDASERITFSAGEAAPQIEVLAELPSWIHMPKISKLDQNASAEIFKAFVANRIASLALREQLDHRQREVSRLALKCLTQLGELEASVTSLDNADWKLTWNSTIEQLLELASQSPEMAEQVHQAFQRVYGNSAPDLWRMLWGYTADQLKNDGAVELVEYLENERPVFRVMSFYNLKKITGKGFHYYPWKTPKLRRQSVKRWQSELDKGKIVPKESNRNIAR